MFIIGLVTRSGVITNKDNEEYTRQDGSVLLGVTVEGLNLSAPKRMSEDDLPPLGAYIAASVLTHYNEGKAPSFVITSWSVKDI